MSEKPTPEELASQLRQPTGDAGIKMGEVMNKSNLFISQKTYEIAELEDFDNVLEIGFGNGKFIKDILNKANNIAYCGIDFSPTMVAEATKENESFIEYKQVEIKEASISDIPYSDNSFDKICTVNTLYFWPNPIDDAKELLRVLKPGGKLVVGIRPKSSVEDMPFTKHGFTLYSPEEAVEVFKKAGFSNVRFNKADDPEVEWEGKKVSLTTICIIAEK